MNFQTTFPSNQQTVSEYCILTDSVIMFKMFNLITGLSIDYMENKLYWISSGNRTINRCNLDGGNLEVIESMKEELKKATALTIMGKCSDSVMRLNLID